MAVTRRFRRRRHDRGRIGAHRDAVVSPRSRCDSQSEDGGQRTEADAVGLAATS